MTTTAAPWPRLARTATVVLWGVLLASGLGAAVLAAVYRTRLFENMLAAAIFAAAVAVTALCAWLLRRPPAARIGPALGLVIVAASGLAIDAYLGRLAAINPRAALARERGISFDTRWVPDVVLDLRRAGTEAYPATTVVAFRNAPLATPSGTVLPYGFVADAAIVLCNESGAYVTVRSDERGFVNPPGLWQAGGEPDVFLVGDSFAEGWCVDQNRAVAGVLRDKGYSVLNVGRNGIGPLAELGAIREYLPGRRPRFVVWVFFEGNDFSDLSAEMASPILKRYLDPGFSQNLLANHAVIDKALRADNVARLARWRWTSLIPVMKWRGRYSPLDFTWTAKRPAPAARIADVGPGDGGGPPHNRSRRG